MNARTVGWLAAVGLAAIVGWALGQGKAPEPEPVIVDPYQREPQVVDPYRAAPAAPGAVLDVGPSVEDVVREEARRTRDEAEIRERAREWQELSRERRGD